MVASDHDCFNDFFSIGHKYKFCYQTAGASSGFSFSFAVGLGQISKKTLSFLLFPPRPLGQAPQVPLPDGSAVLITVVAVVVVVVVVIFVNVVAVGAIAITVTTVAAVTAVVAVASTDLTVLVRRGQRTAHFFSSVGSRHFRVVGVVVLSCHFLRPLRPFWQTKRVLGVSAAALVVVVAVVAAVRNT